MFNIKVPILLLGFFGLTYVQSVYYRDCGSLYHINSIEIDGCGRTATSCLLQIGQDKKITFNFKTNDITTQKLTQEVFLVIRGIHIGIEVTPNLPCDQIKCPLTAGGDITDFTATMQINDTLIPVDGELYWSIRGEHDKKVVCIKTEIILEYTDTVSDPEIPPAIPICPPSDIINNNLP